MARTDQQPATTGPEVRVERLGSIGRIVLDRPRALNALTLGMVATIRDALEGWRDAGLRAITVESASDRAFSAGGDVRWVRENTLAGQHEESLRFFATEYAVNELLGSFPVPVVALVDGICMGGGMGLSVHGPFRVVGPRASFAMPETKIGLFPDVGGSYFLPRLPGNVGRYLGLTGARVDAQDALAFGIATHACSAEDLATLPERLASYDGPVEHLLRELARADPLDPVDPVGSGDPGVGDRARRAEIDWAFGAPGIDGVRERLDRLTRRGDDAAAWAKGAFVALDAASPYSLAVTDRLLAEGRERDLAGCLRAELATMRDVIATDDFVEGVRSVLVDKDHAPRWSTPLP